MRNRLSFVESFLRCCLSVAMATSAFAGSALIGAAGLTIMVNSPSAFAGNGVPNLLPFQGRLTDENGHPINYEVTVNFRIFPPAGTCYIYEETQVVAPNAYGIFSVVLRSDPVLRLPAEALARSMVRWQVQRWKATRPSLAMSAELLGRSVWIS